MQPCKDASSEATPGDGANRTRLHRGPVSSRSPGFSLVELMVVVAICSILASVAIPAYTNYINRSMQTDAFGVLMLAQQEQETFWSDSANHAYANTIGCLPSFCDEAGDCLTDCSTCGKTSHQTPGGYNISVISANANSFRIEAGKAVNGNADTIFITESTASPTIKNPDAIKSSILQMVFGH